MDHLSQVADLFLQAGYLSEVDSMLSENYDETYIARQLVHLVDLCNTEVTGEALYNELYGD